jgi:hypothetical protein
MTAALLIVTTHPVLVFATAFVADLVTFAFFESKR